MKLSNEGIVTTQPYLGPLTPADGAVVNKLEATSPAPSLMYSAAYSPHTQVRSISEMQGYQSQVKISEDILPNGVPTLPKEPDRLPWLIAIGVGAFFALKYFKRG